MQISCFKICCILFAACIWQVQQLSTGRTNKPWPSPFIFLTYALRAGVQQKLHDGEGLNRGERSHITDAVYQEVTKYT